MKKVLAILLSALMTVGLLAACGNGNSTGGGSDAGSTGPVSLSVWGPQEEQALLQEMCDAFVAQSGKDITIELGVVSEADARARYSEDPEAAADVFMFPNDQLNDFVNAQSLYEVTRNKDDIVARNNAGAIEASEYDGSLYAYPMTADNGYFLYYDKSVFTEDDVKTLDGMLAKADAAGKKVFMDISNGWYIVSFFFGAGCEMSLSPVDGTIVCDFNGPNGLAAAEAIKAFTANPAFLTGDDAVLTGGMGESIAAGVSGTWNADAIIGKLGDNYAATKLPTFTCGGEQKQMSGYAGYKNVGVNSLTKSPVEACDLADWLTNEANQVKRFEVRGLGPANLKAASSAEVQANVALAALAAQNEFSKPQINVPNGFWTPAEAFGTTLEAKDYSTPLQDMLDSFVQQVTTV